MFPMLFLLNVVLADPTPPPYLDLAQMLVWLQTVGGAIVSAAVVSFLAEHWLWFQSRNQEFKRFFMVTLSVLIAAGAWAVKTYVPPETLAAWQPFFSLVMMAALTALMQQGYHVLNRNLNVHKIFVSGEKLSPDIIFKSGDEALEEKTKP